MMSPSISVSNGSILLLLLPSVSSTLDPGALPAAAIERIPITVMGLLASKGGGASPGSGDLTSLAPGVEAGRVSQVDDDLALSLSLLLPLDRGLFCPGPPMMVIGLLTGTGALDELALLSSLLFEACSNLARNELDICLG